MKEILGNGLDTIVSQALQKMKEEQGESFRIETVNLATLQRMTGISRARLRRWKRNLLSPEQCSRKKKSILSDYTSVLDHLLSSGISNTVICFERLKQLGYNHQLLQMVLPVFTLLSRLMIPIYFFHIHQDEASDAFYLAVYIYLLNSIPLESSASLRDIAS